MSDDFERAVIIVFNFSGAVDAQLKEQANAYVTQLTKLPDCWRLCIERFSSTPYQEVKFWCLQTLHEFVKNAYSSLNSDSKSVIKNSFWSWVQYECNTTGSGLAPFLRNKLAQTIVAVLQVEYPKDWPSFFQDFIRLIPQGDGVVDMFCRVLVAVDEDVISLDIPRTQDESRLSMHIKDSLREHAIADIAAAWTQLVEAYHSKNPDLAASILQTMQHYISWMDITLSVNNKFIPLLQLLLKSPSACLQSAALDCLQEILSKRMEASPKISLIEQLGIVPVAAQWAQGFPVDGDDGGGDDAMLLVKYAQLLASLAAEIMDSLKRVENGMISLTAMGFDVGDDAASEVASATATATAQLSQLFPAVLAAFKSQVDEVCLPLLPFLAAYVARLKTLHKRTQTISAEARAHIHAILEGLAACARYPPDSCITAVAGPPADSSTAAAREEREAVEEKRRELFTLFKNIAKICFSETLGFVGALLQHTLVRHDATFQEVEIALVLLYELGEGAPEEALKPGSGQGSLGQLVVALTAAQQVPCASHRLVAGALLEAFTRYAKVLEAQPAYLPPVLLTFLDARGIGHPSEDVASRACYLFCRFVKTLRGPVRHYLATIAAKMQPLLVRIATSPLATDSTSGAGPATASPVRDTSRAAPNSSNVDDRLYAFEALGLLLGGEDTAPEHQSSLLSASLQPLLAQISSQLQSPSSCSPALLLQALEAVARLSKGFKTDLCTRTRPQIGAMFVQSLEVGLMVPQSLPCHRLLRQRFISFLHRMVECLHMLALPYLPAALELLMHAQVDALELCDVLALLNQLLVRYKAALAGLLEQLLPTLVARILGVLADWDWSGKAASPAALTSCGGGGGASSAAEDAREKSELQRAFYALLAAVTSNNISGALLRAPPGVVDAVMGALTRGAATHVDPCVRRTCLQVYQKLMGDWCGATPHNAEPVPGFARYAMEHLGGEACVLGLIRGPPLDTRDASTVAFLGEVAAALKLVYEKCGDAFPTYLAGTVLPAVGCPAPLTQQLMWHIREGGVKELKDFLRTFMQAISGGGGGPGQPSK